MTEKEKLTKLISECCDCTAIIDCIKDDCDECHANYLIKNGVIVLPAKVGTKVAVIESQTSNGKNLYIFEDFIQGYVISSYGVFMSFEDHISVERHNWTNVFVGENAREKAEAALAERRKDDTEK